MLTCGVKTRSDAETLIADGRVDLIGLARPLVLDPDLPNNWATGNGDDPVFPAFESPPRGGVTAWYTMQLTAIAHGHTLANDWTPESALVEYDERDTQRAVRWRQRFERR
ncbi:MAG: hypothetical protein QNM02_09920 [Acidimicrobiia bacterium]|nr:hypothetical protein [Acidimicrobiia bacterium]